MYATPNDWYIIIGLACLLVPTLVYILERTPKKRKDRTKRPKQ